MIAVCIVCSVVVGSVGVGELLVVVGRACSECLLLTRSLSNDGIVFVVCFSFVGCGYALVAC